MKLETCKTCGSPDIKKDKYKCSYCGNDFREIDSSTYLNERGEETRSRSLNDSDYDRVRWVSERMLRQVREERVASALSGALSVAGGLFGGLLQR